MIKGFFYHSRLGLLRSKWFPLSVKVHPLSVEEDMYIKRLQLKV